MNSDLWPKVQRHLSRLNNSICVFHWIKTYTNGAVCIFPELIVFNSSSALESYLDGLEGEK